MITLAIAAAFFYFTRQNYSIFNGYSGFNLVVAAGSFGVNWRDPVPFYYLTPRLRRAVLSGGRLYRAHSLRAGASGRARQPAAHGGAGFQRHRPSRGGLRARERFAAVGGILLVWQNAQIAPGTAGIPPAIDILVIAVVGGMRRPLGPFIGALIYVLLQVFSSDILLAFSGFSGDRFKLVIGFGFLAIVLFSPDGVLGLWDRWRAQGCGAQRPQRREAGHERARRVFPHEPA